MRLYSLGSGSSGNSFLVQTDQVALLIDCGVAARSCHAALKDLAVDNLAGILISHEHIDHVRSVESVLRWADCPVVTTHGTFGALGRELRWDRRAHGQRFADAGVEVTFVEVSHDAAEPCGFVVEAAGTRIAVFTDLGYVSEVVLEELRRADIVVLEANYDQHLLATGRYPAHLKRRIQGPKGHLSNDDCAAAVIASVSERTRAIWLAHLSENNNTPAAATATVTEALALVDLDIPVSPLPRFTRADVTAAPAKQLAFSL